MQTTTNYGLNIAEGTDKYNHLTVDNPNYEAIDEQMKKNEVASVAVATEATTGNVHAITLPQVDNAVFRYTATSVWHSGDTMTVNDSQVTALLSDGTTLGEGAYTIGAEVLCIKVGQRVTVMVQRGAVAVASDSEKLGGQLPSYYATALAAETANNAAIAAGELATQADGRITDLESIVSNKQDKGDTVYAEGNVRIRVQGDIVAVNCNGTTVANLKSALQANVPITDYSVTILLSVIASNKLYPAYAARSANSSSWVIRQYTPGQAATDSATSSQVYGSGTIIK